MFKVRFHLAQGRYYKHWQIKNLDSGELVFVEPHNHNLVLTNCKLINKKGVARSIHNGGGKLVCSWILCTCFEVVDANVSMKSTTDYKQLRYNPRTAPNWVDNETGADIDNTRYPVLYTSENRVYCNTYHKRIN